MIKRVLSILVFATALSVPVFANDQLPVFGGEAQTPFTPDLPVLPPYSGH